MLILGAGLDSCWPCPPLLYAGGGQDPSCLLGPAPLADVLDQYRYNNTCAELVDGIAASPEAEAAKKEKKAKCDGMVPEESGGCGKGKAPLVSVTAMHEIHLFIFYAGEAAVPA